MLPLDLTRVIVIGQRRDCSLIGIVILIDTRIIVLQVVTQDAALGDIFSTHLLLGQLNHLLRATLFQLDLQVVDPSHVFLLPQVELVHPA